MANERRPGDWQNRDHDEANTLLRTPNPKKWYQQTVWIILFLLVLWPVGLVLAWRSDWHVAFKIIATVLILAMVYMWWTMTQAVVQMPTSGF